MDEINRFKFMKGLQKAVEKGDVEVEKYLKATEGGPKKYNPKKPTPKEYDTDKTKFMIGLQKASERGNEEIEKYLIATGGSPPIRKNRPDPLTVVGTTKSREKAIQIVDIINKNTAKQWTSSWNFYGDGVYEIKILNINDKRPQRNMINKFSKILDEL
ncbi:MAG: hypothetical protein K8R25_12485 [Methanosarcinales archaeon]|nr:hypothetical protein [Methanosarcinales archaeon]